jgi:hypothetical protein
VEYPQDEYKLYEKSTRFNQAVTRKLGHPPTTGNAEEVKNALGKKMQERIIKDNLVVFEGVYGWAVTYASGRCGDVHILTKEDLD